ncbi:uncharacterized protein L969DRAFT_92878 [Mixia osmundae IAM 14324]|uniref:Core domain-containing protein n=1 Tax=Mixia osmundae (strain CBS 9802 / IAM 14324 / JCM 22182 / KY 12970) TaxID=764103 RepID=G7DYU4_MIXOS|nr:uncharacterized protein L969DRAFT_92878 [Mixia osmundae IAM 14324]KEI41650.1 hypothetical protein L969DRAFT_92878 [Mixia osmundae IAM 14324]GAA95754.1 hypothetical protein E5Q_02411 [Mixia osmundae IAM 14324]
MLQCRLCRSRLPLQRSVRTLSSSTAAQRAVSASRALLGSSDRSSRLATHSQHEAWAARRSRLATLVASPAVSPNFNGDLMGQASAAGEDDPFAEPAPLDESALSLNITPSAVKQVQKIQQRESNANLALRITVESGGCHGYQYKMDLADINAKAEDDYVFSSEPSSPDTPILIIDAMSLGLVKGSTVDFATELIGSSFRVSDNPQAKGAGCGCGVSWELK